MLMQHTNTVALAVASLQVHGQLVHLKTCHDGVKWSSGRKMHLGYGTFLGSILAVMKTAIISLSTL